MRLKKIIFILLFPLSLVSQDSTNIKGSPFYKFYKLPHEMKKNFLYIMPVTSLLGEGWLALGIWAGMGYDRLILSKVPVIVGARLGMIIISEPNENNTGGYFYTSIPHTERSAGVKLNLEHKLLFKKKLYYSSNIFSQHTTTYRKGEYIENVNGIIKLNDNKYKVNRTVIAFIPKIGFMFVNKYGLFTDVGLGIGVRYISSFSKNKIEKQSNKDPDEYYLNKLFDDGSKIAQRITFQFKIGYNF